MSKKHIIISILIILIVLAAGIITLYAYSDRYQDFRCQSDVSIRKTWSNGDSNELKLSTFFLFNNPHRVTVIHKGILKSANHVWIIDRNLQIKVDKLKGSNIYYIADKKITRTPDDTAPPDIVSEMMLDSVNYFYMSRIKENALLIQGFVLPVMMCVDIGSE
ncbi:hypothetical protein GIX45_21495 [Erwinia sp. CPCC 100877]|nr:hypothetical protein [Erwinia sp. CPCC 100877]